MLKISSFLNLIALISGLFLVNTSVNAQQMFKCKVNGTVTFQQDPCPVGQIRKPPTVQELNAGEKKRRDVAALAQEKAAADPKNSQNFPSSEKFTPTASNPPSVSALTGSFSCDGRKHCSQMRSCAEANYFLANCPGVKMDGDNDGIPCEEQWCSR
jgi:Excalibur calcium-binding domain